MSSDPQRTAGGGDGDGTREILAAGGEAGALMRATNWAASKLGAVAAWPQSLRSALSICLGSRFPIAIYWGPSLALLYNDAWRPILGTKHPWALGRPAREVWPEIWESIGPLFEQVMTTGEATYSEDSLLPMYRHGYTEECYFNFTFSPIRGERGRVEGVFNAVIETTFRVLSERRSRVLRELAEHTTGARSPAEACARAAASLAAAAHDVPFCALYLADPAGHTARLAACAGIAAGDPLAPPVISLDASDGAPWPLAAARAAGRVPLATRLAQPAPGGPWPEPAHEALIAPLHAGAAGQLVGFAVLGASPRRALDAEYVQLAERVAAQIATAISTATTYEEERRRAEQLAELDRAKTAFFSNISHELRTPLTLMLGPLEDALAGGGALAGADLEMAHRNALRLLRLVNALLDFSRLEAGRMAARPEPTDLGELTADLASTFRSAIERAGLRFEVDTAGVTSPASVDRGMWEKIVLNLLSNALKFTFEGAIRVALRRRGDRIELEVADTGTGIPAGELSRVFQRFHRIENARARTHEGTGIGLALVQELARLHGGAARVESEVGRGTTFIVSLPAEAPALAEAPPPAATPTPASARAFVDEAARWVLPEPAPAGATAAGGRARILLADDNADMRDYLRRLLAAHGTVEAVGDGLDAVEAARRAPPDLVITDVMMPGLDGFGVVAALRADPRTRRARVIMLSARAGEEARLEGLAAGADDYVVKPFSARELGARVRIQLEHGSTLAQSERELTELYALLVQVPARIIVRRGPEHVCVFQNAESLAISDERGKPVRARRPVIAAQQLAIYDRVRATGEHHTEREIAVHDAWDAGPPRTRYWDATYAPLRLPDGRIDGVITIAFEVTAAVLARQQAVAAEALRATAQERLQAALDASSIGTYFWDVRTNTVEHDEGVKRMFGFAPGEGDPIEDYTARVHAADRDAWLAALARSANDGADFHQEYRIVWPDGSVRWVLDKGRMSRGPDGAPLHLAGAVVDITEPKRLAEEALAAGRAKDEFLAVLGHELRNPLAPIMTAVELTKLRGDPMTKELRTIERQVHHLAHLVDDLLDISRITRGQIELQHELLALDAVIAKAFEIASPLIEQKVHRVSIDVDRSLHVTGDPVRLAQVFSNLLTNAARYTPRGGHIRVAAHREGERAVVRVADDGIGIAPELLGRIFDLFVQGGRTLARSEGGLGIGLALVRSLVGLHGGEALARSEGPGKGSVFEIRLPLADPPPAEPAAEPGAATTAAPAPAGRRVLVVVDNADAAARLGDALRAGGHDVQLAHDGAEALRRAGHFRPEAAVLDLGLPVMDGYELARRLRELLGGAPCRLIALTGYGQAVDPVRSREARFDVHLVKPVDLGELVRELGPP